MESTPWIVSPGSDGEQARDSSQQQPSPARLELTVARADGLPRLRTLFLKKERKYYVTATDGLRTEKTLAIRSTAQSVQWDKTLSGLTINSSSPLIVRVFARRTWLRDVRLGLLTIPFETIRSSPLQEFNIPFDSRNMTLVLSITLPEASQHATSGDVSSPKTLRAPILSKGSDPGPPAGPIISSDDSDPADPMQVAERRLARAGEAVANLGNVQSFPLELAKVADEAPDQLQKAADLYDTWKEVLDNVKIVVDMVDKIAEIHPYAKMAWSILSCIPRVRNPAPSSY
ncbi:hypothetical protein BC834DRAFT_638252 [Gloeopeniophorella convolvens]|nr:hypothetical protein BC834DRAFT_638252 [Gloeopeniophorella convolvens]